MADNLEHHSLETEEWREYEFEDCVYRITAPKELIFRKGGTTHRVVDQEDIVHLLPMPGTRGCVLRWKSKPGCSAVEF